MSGTKMQYGAANAGMKRTAVGLLVAAIALLAGCSPLTESERADVRWRLYAVAQAQLGKVPPLPELVESGEYWEARIARDPFKHP